MDMDVDKRHEATRQLIQWFSFDHLPTGSPREVSEQLSFTVGTMLKMIPIDTPEFTAGLRKLLEAKDCFVRAAIAAEKAKLGA